MYCRFRAAVCGLFASASLWLAVAAPACASPAARSPTPSGGEAATVSVDEAMAKAAAGAELRPEEREAVLRHIRASLPAETRPSKEVDRQLRLLGKLRAVESLDVLISHLTVATADPRTDKEDGEYDYRPIEVRFPAIGALEELGADAVPALLRAVARGDVAGPRLSYAGYVVSRILGKEAPGRVEAFIKEVKDPDQRARLKDHDFFMFFETPTTNPSVGAKEPKKEPKEGS